MFDGHIISHQRPHVAVQLQVVHCWFKDR